VIEVVKAHGVNEISVNVDTADETLVAALGAAGIEFGVWAAHDVPRLETAFRLGAKALTCDRPSLAIAVRKRLAEQAA
jgi:glycerophosphoryl diester phosphodiesterase